MFGRTTVPRRESQRTVRLAERIAAREIMRQSLLDEQNRRHAIAHGPAGIWKA